MQQLTSNMKAKLTLLSAVLLTEIFLPRFSQGQAFPPIGYDTGPGIILTINANGTLSVTRTNQGPYDNIEDTYIGIVNNSTHTIFSIQLQSPNGIFAFDGDGICGNDPNTGMPFDPAPPGCPFIDPNLYGGPGVTFSNINATQTAGTVNFQGGLGPNQWTYFGLEEAIETTCDPIPGINVPPFLQRQYDPQWKNITYDDDPPVDANGRPNTIGRWGCFLSCCSMLINYHAAAQGSAFRTDPAALNDWLHNHHGYAGGDVDPVAVGKYARANGVSLWPTGGVGYKGMCITDDFTVDTYLCSNEPVLLKVINPTSGHDHFVLATGQTAGQGKFLINDPGYNRTTLADYRSAYCGVRLFSSMQTPAHALRIIAHSPVELLLTDPSGNKTGSDPLNGQDLNQIPAASYLFDSIGDDDDPSNGTTRPETKTLDIPTPADGIYILKVSGTGTGPYTIDFIGYDSNADSTSRMVSGTATPGSVAEYQINYSSEPGAQISVMPIHHVTVSSLPANGGNATGGGSFAQGSNVTVTATPNPGYSFLGWFENGSVVSRSASYTFSLSSDRNLLALFGSNSSVTAPHIYPPGGTFSKKVIVTMSCDTPGATIYYTTDGTIPTTSSNIYPTQGGRNRGITISRKGAVTVKAKGVKAGSNDSAITVVNYTIR